MDFHGRWHHISAAGINPLPAQRPIPIWMGGSVGASLRRIGRLATGWIPLSGSDDDTLSVWRPIQGCAKESGRDPSEIGMDARDWLSHTHPSERDAAACSGAPRERATSRSTHATKRCLRLATLCACLSGSPVSVRWRLASPFIAVGSKPEPGSLHFELSTLDSPESAKICANRG
ncbi:MAG: LLM class flavin-dependent oxidoreductase [Chloroflexota bacterium]